MANDAAVDFFTHDRDLALRVLEAFQERGLDPHLSDDVTEATRTYIDECFGLTEVPKTMLLSLLPKTGADGIPIEIRDATTGDYLWCGKYRPETPTLIAQGKTTSPGIYGAN